MSIAIPPQHVQTAAASTAIPTHSTLSRADPVNIDLAVTEPIDISSMIQLLLDRE